MALGDYRRCDVCDGKTFYDAKLNYEYGTDYAWNHRPYRIAGAEQYPNPEINAKRGYRLDYVGDWAVICENCAKTHRTAIVPLTDPASAGQRPQPEQPEGVQPEQPEDKRG